MSAVRNLFALSTIALAACGTPEGESQVGFTAQDLEGNSHQITVLDAQHIKGVDVFELQIDGAEICSLSIDQSPELAQFDVVCGDDFLVMEQSAEAWTFGDGERSHYSAEAPCADALADFDATATMLVHADTVAQLPSLDQPADGTGVSKSALSFSRSFGGASLNLPRLGYEGGNGCSGTYCESDDGSASCCCGTNKRCKSYPKTCECQDATGVHGGFGGIAETLGG
ncbi:MAG: hypothetical protein ACE366_27060 [Bradymonadia bacterium]